MNEMINDDKELDKVVELLTPKFQRKCEFAYAKPRKRLINRLWAIGGIAAMFVVVLTIAVKSVMPVSATEVISSALASLSDTESIKVEFAFRGEERVARDEIYRPRMSGDMIDGTLYLLRKGGKVHVRLDWHDAEKNSIVLNGSDYIHLKNGTMVEKHPSSFGNELMELINFNSLPDMLKDPDKFSSSGNIIKGKFSKDIITVCCEFRRDNKQLIKVSATAPDINGNEISIFETQSIEIDADIPETMLSE